jgi:hypothetical protein
MSVPRHAVRLLSAAEVQHELIAMHHAIYERKAQALFESLRQRLSMSELDAAGMSLEQVLTEAVV